MTNSLCICGHKEKQHIQEGNLIKISEILGVKNE
jgi:hypothetical protein